MFSSQLGYTRSPRGRRHFGVRIYPEIVFRVYAFGTILVQHQKHLVTWVGCTSPLCKDILKILGVTKIRRVTGLFKVRPVLFSDI